MKKVLVIAAAALFASSVASAQDVMKQTGGEQNLEVLFAPLGGSPVKIGGIKYRKFTSATTAIRGTVFLGFSSDKSVDGGQASIVKDGESLNAMKTKSTFDIQIAPGVERHFVGTDRLSPYIGGEVNLGFGNSSTKYEKPNDDNTAFVDGGKTTNGSLSIGATAFAGFDFYFADNIYLGSEIGFGAYFTSKFDEKTKPEGGDEFTSGPQGSSFGIGPNFVAQIRLGWLF